MTWDLRQAEGQRLGGQPQSYSHHLKMVSNASIEPLEATWVTDCLPNSSSRLLSPAGKAAPPWNHAQNSPALHRVGRCPAHPRNAGAETSHGGFADPNHGAGTAETQSPFPEAVSTISMSCAKNASTQEPAAVDPLNRDEAHSRNAVLLFFGAARVSFALYPFEGSP